ncbi:15318_t:CDS:2 [Rhizophagus irregularis]|nr:15318_t:CDS:2 [Rhizophagus irregularis]
MYKNLNKFSAKTLILGADICAYKQHTVCDSLASYTMDTSPIRKHRKMVFPTLNSQ